MAIRAGFSLTEQQFCSTMIAITQTFLMEKTMSDVPHDGGSPIVRNILMVVAVVYLIGTVIFMVQAQGRINDLEKKQAAAQAELTNKMTDSNAQMKAS